jgi:UDP-N-acetyl-D-galactosamine dehydrogenase
MQFVYCNLNQLNLKKIALQNKTIAILGLGYVGLPLAMAFAEKYSVIGFDINPLRIAELKNGFDKTGEADTNDLNRLKLESNQEVVNNNGIYFSATPDDLAGCAIFIITVPTPVDGFNKPDLSLLEAATRTVAQVLSRDNLVIYESTVFPGCTEEIAIPILEKISGLIVNKDFYCGYSPERINPGDKVRTLAGIRKITSGSNELAAEMVDKLYQTIIIAGTYRAPSIKVAEAAKVIENTQRDINIAFVNELAKIFALMQIDTQEVLKAAATKWNFLPFQPGLVGGHCIGVDPYYLADKAESLGYHPSLILAARKINDSMGDYIATRVLRLMAIKGIAIKGASVLVLGIAFKENFSDVRNSRVVDLIKVLKTYQMEVTIYDPLVSSEAVENEYGLSCLIEIPNHTKFDGVIIAVNHKIFESVDYLGILKDDHFFFDVKAITKNGVADEWL